MKNKMENIRIKPLNGTKVIKFHVINNAFHFKLPMPLDGWAHTSFNLKSLAKFEPSALMNRLLLVKMGQAINEDLMQSLI